MTDIITHSPAVTLAMERFWRRYREVKTAEVAGEASPATWEERADQRARDPLLSDADLSPSELVRRYNLIDGGTTAFDQERYGIGCLIVIRCYLPSLRRMAPALRRMVWSIIEGVGAQQLRTVPC